MLDSRFPRSGAACQPYVSSGVTKNCGIDKINHTPTDGSERPRNVQAGELGSRIKIRSTTDVLPAGNTCGAAEDHIKENPSVEAYATGSTYCGSVPVKRMDEVGRRQSSRLSSIAVDRPKRMSFQRIHTNGLNHQV